MTQTLVEYKYRGPIGSVLVFAKVLNASKLAVELQFDAAIKYKDNLQERVFHAHDPSQKAALSEEWISPVTICGVTFPGVHTIIELSNLTIRPLDQDEDEEVDKMTEGEMIQFVNILINANSPMTFRAAYTNYKGVTAVRTVRPLEVWHGGTEWHPEIGWMLTALDLGKGETRSFRLTDFDFDSITPSDIRKLSET